MPIDPVTLTTIGSQPPAARLRAREHACGRGGVLECALPPPPSAGFPRLVVFAPASRQEQPPARMLVCPPFPAHSYNRLSLSLTLMDHNSSSLSLSFSWITTLSLSLPLSLYGATIRRGHAEKRGQEEPSTIWGLNQFHSWGSPTLFAGSRQDNRSLRVAYPKRLCWLQSQPDGCKPRQSSPVSLFE